MLADLAVRMEAMACSNGHQNPIRYVDTSRKSYRRFLCNDCLQLDDHADHKDKIIDLKDYMRGLRMLASNHESQIQANNALFTETESGLEVIQLLGRDLADSLGGIKSMVQSHYADLISKVQRNAAKCTDLVVPPIDKDLKRQLFELSSIEKNLSIMKEGGNPADVCQILDQALDYTSKKHAADNGLYHLLAGLNPLEAAQSTHLRLAAFSDKYLTRKRHLIKGVKANLEKRFKKDELMLQEFIDQRKKILTSIESYLEAAQKEEETNKTGTNKNLVSFKEERSVMRKALSKFGFHRHTKGDLYLGKRRPLTPDYDPISSFEKKFGNQNLPSYEEQMNKLKVSGLKPSASRLSDVLKTRKPTQQSRLYTENGTQNSNSNQLRYRSKRNSGTKTLPVLELEPVTTGESIQGLGEAISKVLQPRNSNTVVSVMDHPYTKNAIQEETIKAMSSRRTAQSYLDYLANEKKKQAAHLNANDHKRPSDDLKENQGISSGANIHEKSQLLQKVMLEVPIKKLNLNDPRRKSMAQTALMTSRSHHN